MSWSGGTSMAESLYSLFERRYGRRRVNSRTVMVIISDGWDRGDTTLLTRAMQAFRRRAHTIIWLNPLLVIPSTAAWIYGSHNNLASLGFVTGLDYPDPRLDPQRVLQEFKKHPFIAKLLEGGKMVRYGAKSLPYGGWWCIPPVAGDGWMILGDSAGFLNSQRLKGIHLAIKSGMLAAETAYDAMAKDDFSLDVLEKFQERVEKSWIKEELWPVRNFHQGFDKGFLSGMMHAGIQQITGGRGLREHYSNHAGHLRMKQLAQLPADGGPEAHIINAAKGDGKLTFDKLTDVYYSGTKHEEDQPAHLVIQDTDICNERCVREYGNPCKNFCPASVYEMVEATDTPSGAADPSERFQLRALQDLRHHGSLRDHYLGASGGRRRAELRGDVAPFSQDDPSTRPGPESGTHFSMHCPVGQVHL